MALARKAEWPARRVARYLTCAANQVNLTNNLRCNTLTELTSAPALCILRVALRWTASEDVGAL